MPNHFSCVQLFATLWAVALQAPALQTDSLPTEPPGKPSFWECWASKLAEIKIILIQNTFPLPVGLGHSDLKDHLVHTTPPHSHPQRRKLSLITEPHT